MAAKWTESEYAHQYSKMQDLYIAKNMTIKEIGILLGISEKTIYKRLQILKIPTRRTQKIGYCNKRADICIPIKHSGDLAEFFGILLGDGHVSHFQTMVTLGSKEDHYVEYVANLFEKICGVKGAISTRKGGYHDVYVGSVELTSWLLSQGLTKNKVKNQVRVPSWIEHDPLFSKRFLRGFFDTDGSIYRLKFGTQLSFTNYSLPLLESLQKMLHALEYSPSAVSSHKIYLTKKEDIQRFFKEVRPMNAKHRERFLLLRNV